MAGPVAGPPASADATRLLDAWAAAIGGRERLARIRGVHMHGKHEECGLVGTLDRWERLDGARREDVRLDGIEWVRVFDGAKGWLRDRNQKVRELWGDELENQVSEAYLASWSALLDGRMPAKIDALAADVVRIAPAGGRRLTVRFDLVTHLPLSIEEEWLPLRRLADWRDVDGVKFPFVIVEEGSEPRTEVSTHLDTIDLDAPPRFGFGRPIEGAPDFRFSSGASAEVPIGLLGSMVIADVRVNDSAPMQFGIDTGASSSLLSASVLGTLGLASVGEARVRAATSGGVPASFVKGVSFALDGVELTKQVVFAAPLELLQSLIGNRGEVGGVLGYDFLSRFVVELDYPNRRMRLHDPAAYRYEGGGSPIPIALQGNVPFALAQIRLGSGGAPVEDWFLVDSGFAGELSFSAPFAEAHPVLGGVPARPDAYAATIDRVQRVAYRRLESIALGRTVITSPEVTVPLDADGSPTNQIGAELLRNFLVTLDYTHHTMYLEKNRLVTKIAFRGNRNIGTDDLGRTMQTRVGSPYDDERLGRDVLFLLALYYDRGMLQAEIRRSLVPVSADEGSTEIVLEITEGRIFKIGKLSLAAEFAPLVREKDACAALLHSKHGAIFSRQVMLEDIQRIVTFFKNRGEDVDVEPFTDLHTAESTVDVIIGVRMRAPPEPKVLSR